MSPIRQKTPHVVIAFDTTSDVMAVEEAAKTHGIPGRIIPVPTEVDAGCGMSWAAPINEHDALIAALQEHGLAYSSVHEVNLY